MKKILIIIAVVAGLAVAYWAVTQTDLLSKNSSQPQPTATPIAAGFDSETAPEQFLPSIPDKEPLLASGSSYADPDGAFTFLYPNGYTVDTEGDGQYTRIFKRGATQKGQTEMYDGVIVLLETVNLQGKTLEEFVDERLASFESSDVVKVSQPKKAVSLNTYPGFTYETEGLGSARDLVIMKNGQSTTALVVTISVMDPENVGYQEEVNAMLSTIELVR